MIGKLWVHAYPPLEEDPSKDSEGLSVPVAGCLRRLEIFKRGMLLTYLSVAFGNYFGKIDVIGEKYSIICCWSRCHNISILASIL